jgi:uncharacterized protein with PQ loop repeat
MLSVGVPSVGSLPFVGTGLSATDLLGLASVVIAFWFAVPQLTLLVRTGSTAGLSMTSLVNSTISLVAWTLYGLAHGSVWVVASSVVGLPSIVATAVLARRDGLQLESALPWVWTWLLMVTAAADIVAGTAMIDAVLGCSILWFVAPQAVTAWRSADVSGIAWQTWALLAVDGLVFGLYGLVSGIGADRVYGSAALLGSAVVVARLLVGDRTSVAGAGEVRGADQPGEVAEPGRDDLGDRPYVGPHEVHDELPSRRGEQELARL